ncbi:hypothetical protein U8016_004229 [Vibrio parahaemolyticus]|nr:hypothetical protein [Vibrio parahaemolyticus]
MMIGKLIKITVFSVWPFCKIKKLKKENQELREVLETHTKPLKLGRPFSASEWASLSDEETIIRLKRLDMILTLKKKGWWDYESNCASIPE